MLVGVARTCGLAGFVAGIVAGEVAVLVITEGGGALDTILAALLAGFAAGILALALVGAAVESLGWRLPLLGAIIGIGAATLAAVTVLAAWFASTAVGIPVLVDVSAYAAALLGYVIGALICRYCFDREDELRLHVPRLR
jgi:hypothetical protein